MKYHVTGPSGTTRVVELLEDREGMTRLTVDGQELQADLREIDSKHLYSLILDGRSHDVTVEFVEDGPSITVDGRVYDFKVLDEIQRRLEASGGARKKRAGPPVIKAEMPGVVVSTSVSAGDEVAAGDVLVVVEAMKMQNEILAPGAAAVVDVPVKAGDVLAAGEPLVKLKYVEE